MQFRSKSADKAGNTAIQLTLFDALANLSHPLPANQPATVAAGPVSFRFQLNEDAALSGEVSRIRANLSAIAIVKALHQDNRSPTHEECRQLALFSGWGSLAALWDEQAYVASRDPERTPEIDRWHRRYQKLRDQADVLMTPIERERAAQSTLNAFYTSVEVTQAVWTLIEQIGFRGGRILEPAAGTGAFIGTMPTALREKSTVTAVEKDSLSAAILTQLYPEATTHAMGLEVAPLNRESFDLVIGNVPFGDYKVFDATDRDLSQFYIHNYFIGKAARLVASGGVVCLITSMGTLDAFGKEFRLSLEAERMELLGAMRLPCCAFEKTAGTQVTTDIVLFQKRPERIARTGYAQAFVNTATLRTLTPEQPNEDEPQPVESIVVNQYFVDNPAFMLGEMTFAREVGKGGLYRNDQQTLYLPNVAQLPDRLRQAVVQLSSQLENCAGRFGDTMTIGRARQPTADPALTGVITIRGRQWSKHSIYRSYTTLKRLFFDLLRAEQTATDAECDRLRTELRDHYQFFVATYGRLTGNRAVSWIEQVDGQLLSVQALEIVRAGPDEKPTISESAILRERVFGTVQKPEHVEQVADGLALSLFEYGSINLSYVAILTRKSVTEVEQHLLASGLAYRDPQQAGRLIEAGTYLSGNVRQKLADLEPRLIDEPEFIQNADALRAVLPPTLPISLIHFQLGSVWLPLESIRDWIESTFDVRIRLIYHQRQAEYGLTLQSGYSAKNAAQGTKERTALELIETALNQRSIIITKTVRDAEGNKKEVKDIEAMTAAVQQQELLQEAFIEWARENYAPAIETAFNDRFNNFVQRPYAKPDLSHYPGANPLITLRNHQFRGVERIKAQNCMLAHSVGTGKTWVMISAAMELIRLGQVSKVMIAVQNSTVDDFAQAWRTLYPGAIVYQPTPADLQAANRKRFLQRIATNRFDGIVIPQSFLKLIPDDAAIEEELIQEELSRIEFDDADNSAEGRASRRSGKQRVKQINKRKAKIEARRLEQASRKKDQMLNFAQLGVDALFLDEAHKYKRFGFTTSRYQIKGIDTAGSQEAFQVMVKCRTILNRNGRVVLATGTPISNTMAEAWTMLRYTETDRLNRMQLATFDQFAGTFGKVVPVFELSTSGQFKTVERFAQFVNVAQLSALYRQSVDVILADDVAEFQSGTTLPGLKEQPASENGPGGPGFTRILLPQTPGVQAELAHIRQTLRWFDALTGKEKRANSHIPLVMYGQAKKATLDVRLLDPTAPDEAGNKINRAVAEIHRIYQQTADVAGTQLVFCDVFKSSASLLDREGEECPAASFNLFDELTRKLRLLGIPPEQIQTVPADKDKREPLFVKVRTGQIRILMGSSERMGVGVNVQQRLAAIHHLDAPNRPTDFEQRNGRIIRQGNRFAEWERAVEILTYGVERTLDATSYGRLAMKQKFINQVLKGSQTVETMADVADEDDFASMNFEQMMATLSGSQTALIYTAKNHELTRLQQQKKAWHRGLMNAHAIVTEARGKVFHLTGLLPKLSWEAEIVRSKFEGSAPDEEETNGLIKTLEINGQVYREKADWTEPLERHFAAIKLAARRSNGGNAYGSLTINGLEFKLQGEWIGNDRDTNRPLYAVNYQWGVNLTGQVRQGWALPTSLRAAVKRTLEAPSLAKVQLERANSTEQEFSQNLNQPFKKQTQLEELALLVDELKAQLEREAVQVAD